MQRIKYYFNNPFNKGTEESPEWVDNLLEKSMPYSEANEEIAKAEAYNGEYTIEDDGQPEPDPVNPSSDSIWDELDAAYQRGVDSV